VIHRDRVPKSNEALTGAPDWGIEILSPNQSTTRVIDKIQVSLQAGMEVGWLIDCTEEVILVLQRARALGVFRGEESLIVPAAIKRNLTPQEILVWVG
jgi:Uma2 family endonuclease